MTVTGQQGDDKWEGCFWTFFMHLKGFAEEGLKEDGQFVLYCLSL